MELDTGRLKISLQRKGRLAESSLRVLISAGVELERSAIEFYRKSADECEDEESAKVFRFLADWEKDHLQNLSDLQDVMKDQYFAEQGFTPM